MIAGIIAHHEGHTGMDGGAFVPSNRPIGSIIEAMKRGRPGKTIVLNPVLKRPSWAVHC